MHLNAYQKHTKQLFLKLFLKLITSPQLNKLVIELNEREYKKSPYSLIDVLNQVQHLFISASFNSTLK